MIDQIYFYIKLITIRLERIWQNKEYYILTSFLNKNIGTRC